jgi:hypothetical protein
MEMRRVRLGGCRVRCGKTGRRECGSVCGAHALDYVFACEAF